MPKRKARKQIQKESDKPFKELERVAEKWNFVAPMDSTRWGHSTNTYGNYIYSIGGYDGEKELERVERYNVNSNTWESVASLKSSRSPHASMTCGILSSVLVAGNTDWR